MTDKELGKAIDKARRKRTRRTLAVQRKAARQVEAIDADWERELDELLNHNHPILNRQDG